MSAIVYRYQGTGISPYNLTTLTLSGNMAPVYNNRLGVKFHSVKAERPEYSLTSRYYPTTEFLWTTENTTETNRDTIKSFYSTTLDEGYNNFTIIDHRRKILFEASWNNWVERWNRRYGGSFNIIYNIESSFGWTPEFFDALITNDDRHMLFIAQSAVSVSASASILKQVTDSNVLSNYGWALRLKGDDGSSKQTGASATVSWDSTRKYNSISMFCQYRSSRIAEGRLHLMEIGHGNNYLRLSIVNDLNGGNHCLYGTVINAGNSVDVEISAGNVPYLTKDTWYDIAITYDAVNSEVKVMWSEASNSSFTRFLSDQTSLSGGMASYLANSYYPNNTVYSSFKLLAESEVDTIRENEYAYIQNAMVIDGYLSAMQFNQLRKLCYIWNSKTSGVNPR